jgi:hypothetical protein
MTMIASDDDDCLPHQVEQAIERRRLLMVS